MPPGLNPQEFQKKPGFSYNLHTCPVPGDLGVNPQELDNTSFTKLNRNLHLIEPMEKSRMFFLVGV